MAGVVVPVGGGVGGGGILPHQVGGGDHLTEVVVGGLGLGAGRVRHRQLLPGRVVRVGGHLAARILLARLVPELVVPVGGGVAEGVGLAGHLPHVVVRGGAGGIDGGAGPRRRVGGAGHRHI